MTVARAAGHREEVALGHGGCLGRGVEGGTGRHRGVLFLLLAMGLRILPTQHSRRLARSIRRYEQSDDSFKEMMNM